MSYNINNQAGVVVIKSGDLDASSTGTTLVGTTYNEGRFLPFSCLVMGTNVTGFISEPTIQIGTAGGSYNDIVTATPLTSINGTNIFTFLNTNFPGTSIPSGTDISVDVTIVGSATNYFIEVYLFGIYDF